MPLRSSKTESTEQSPGNIWNTIVRITNSVGSDEAKAIRVLLYLVLLAGRESTLWERLRSRVNFARRMALPRGKPVPAGRKGCPLFAFLYDTPANTNNLLPVFQAAQKRGLRPYVLSGEGFDLSRKGFTGASGSVGVREIRSLTTTTEWLAALTGARKHFAAVSAEFERQAPQCIPLIRKGRAGIESELALAMVATLGLTRIYTNWQPSFVISTSNMWPFDCAVFDQAARLGIPSFVVQHGVTNRYWWPFVASKMLLWGKAFEKELLNLGAPAAQLAIGGMPAADHLFSRYQDVSRDVGKTASSFLILSDTQTRHLYPEPYDKFRILFKAVVAATPTIRWSIKLHPLEDDSFYREMLGGRFPNFSILPKATSLEDAVRQSDVACTLWSTSGLESMMMRRPLLVFDLDPMVYEHAWWPQCGGGTYAPTTEAVLAFVRKASSDPHFIAELVTRQDQFLAENFANPGRAAEAVLDTIEEAVRTSKSGISFGANNPHHAEAVSR